MPFRKSISAAVAALGVTAVLATSEQAVAQPFASGAVLSAKPESDIRKVYWRHGWGFPFWGGPAIVGGVIIGGALVASAVAERRADRMAMRRCADDFPSFSPRTGTYINRRGEERVCPYLY